MAGADTVLRIAEAEDGYHESGTNRTKFGRAFGWDGVAWCAIFVWWVFWRAGLLALLPTKTASAPGLAEAFQRAGRWGHTPREGAVVFFDLNGNGGIDHVGIVIARLADGRVKTVEGNTANGVHIRYRSPSLIAGYGYPDYAQEDDMQPSDKLKIGDWMRKHWSKDPTITDGTIAVNTALGSGYGHARAAHENTDKLVAMIAAQNVVLDKLADAITANAPDIEALKQEIKDELSKIVVHLDVDDETGT